MDDIVDAVAAVVPPKYQPLVLAIPVMLMIGGRIYHAFMTGGGFVGAVKGFMFGTNVPSNPAPATVPQTPHAPPAS